MNITWFLLYKGTKIEIYFHKSSVGTPSHKTEDSGLSFL